MTALVSAMDSMTLNQVGENNHIEYSWSCDNQEKILQLSFQLTRTNDKKQNEELGTRYFSLIKEAVRCKDGEKINKKDISLLYRLMVHTRDIVKGKGEYNLFYIMLGEWVRLGELAPTLYKNYKESKYIIDSLIKLALSQCTRVTINDKEEHGYGSYKDLKYFLNYMKTSLNYSTAQLENITAFNDIITIMSERLKLDSLYLKNKDNVKISLLARWLPREKSAKFGWIAKYVAKEYYKDWIYDKERDSEKYKKSLRKALTYYRKNIAALNKELDTVQIKQCGKNWKDIDFNKNVTSMTLTKQKNAFNYSDKEGNIRGYDKDRLVCKDKYTKYINDCMSGKKEIKAARCSLVDLVKDAVSNTSNSKSDKTLIDTLNLQWETLGKQIGDLGNMIAMVDTSGSMNSDNALFAAFGLGCRIAEKSKLGKRVITFSQLPEWVNLESTNTLTDMVKIVKNSNWGMNTNFTKAMDMILAACVKKNIPPHEVSDMILVVLSDMQIDQADASNKEKMYEMIKRKFHEGGMKTSHKAPYNPPHILFWNLRSTKGFPSLSTTENSSMLSGFNPVLLNTFCEKGMEALLKCTPWSILQEQLDNERYIFVTEVLENIEKYIENKENFILNTESNDLTKDISTKEHENASQENSASQTDSIQDNTSQFQHIDDSLDSLPETKPTLSSGWLGLW